MLQFSRSLRLNIRVRGFCLVFFSPQVFPAKWLIFRPTNHTKNKNPGPRSPVFHRWATDMLTNVGVVVAAERAPRSTPTATTKRQRWLLKFFLKPYPGRIKVSRNQWKNQGPKKRRNEGMKEWRDEGMKEWRNEGMKEWMDEWRSKKAKKQGSKETKKPGSKDGLRDNANLLNTCYHTSIRFMQDFVPRSRPGQRQNKASSGT